MWDPGSCRQPEATWKPNLENGVIWKVVLNPSSAAVTAWEKTDLSWHTGKVSYRQDRNGDKTALFCTVTEGQRGQLKIKATSVSCVSIVLQFIL